MLTAKELADAIKIAQAIPRPRDTIDAYREYVKERSRERMREIRKHKRETEHAKS